jgi:hypothetical protein
LPPDHNEAGVAVIPAAVIPAAVIPVAVGPAAIIPVAADRRVIPTIDREDTSGVRVVTSSSEVVSTTHSGDRSTRMGMDIRMGTRTGRPIIRRTSRGA